MKLAGEPSREKPKYKVVGSKIVKKTDKEKYGNEYSYNPNGSIKINKKTGKDVRRRVYTHSRTYRG
jgi:hypothetical protein